MYKHPISTLIAGLILLLVFLLYEINTGGNKLSPSTVTAVTADTEKAYTSTLPHDATLTARVLMLESEQVALLTRIDDLEQKLHQHENDVLTVVDTVVDIAANLTGAVGGFMALVSALNIARKRQSNRSTTARPLREDDGIFARLRGLIFSDLSALRLLLSMCAFSIGLGFLISDTHNTNYEFIHFIAAQHVWGLFFVFHGCFQLYASLYYVKYAVRIIESSVAVWLWSFIFCSFTVFDETPTSATEWMLILPLLIEIWVMTQRKSSLPRC